MIATPALVALAIAAAGIGSLGGIGGAVLLVPLLVLLGVDPIDAAPLGVLTVASGSLAAAPQQLQEGLVHHRLGITLEIAAWGARSSGRYAAKSDLRRAALSRVLGVVAVVAALAGGRRKGMRNPPIRCSPRSPRRVARHPRPGRTSSTTAPSSPWLAGSRWGWGRWGSRGSCRASPRGRRVHQDAHDERADARPGEGGGGHLGTVGITAATSLLVFAAQGRIDASARRGGRGRRPGRRLGGCAGAGAGAAEPGCGAQRRARWPIGVMLVVTA